ncbi:MAG: acetyl-CoA carboxylase biotin carboxyl carrier protein [Planctomycetota bacterium]
MAAKKKKKASKAKKKTASTRKKPVAKKASGRTGAAEGAGRVAEIKRIIDVMVAAGAVEVEMEDKGSRLRVRLKEDQPLAVMPYGAAPAAAPVAEPIPAAEASESGAAAQSPAMDSDTFVFNSPMVGTFFRAPSPEAEAFVRVGQEVTSDTTLCILEAMKVMNEIKAEVDGVIVEILAENGESIEFGQPLFVLRAA